MAGTWRQNEIQVMKAVSARSLLLMVVLAGSFSFCGAQAAEHLISFNNVHHRGAHGAWAGFEHFIKGKADDRNSSRHILYGALVAEPDHNDVFPLRERAPTLAATARRQRLGWRKAGRRNGSLNGLDKHYSP
jgi:hypothetical protein